VLHGPHLGYNPELRIKAVVHLRAEIQEHDLAPMAWVAVGSPAHMFPPEKHGEIWAIQQRLNFPKSVYGVERPDEGESNIPAITARRSQEPWRHHEDHRKSA
jgi:hypothetical protein